MELVYLWIKKYKNIKERGFNFSPRFDCKFDGKKLTIEDKSKDYISIFPDNINITAIVGKNGSGKSSILSLLPIDKQTITESIMIYKLYDEQIHISSNIKGIQYSNKYKIEEPSNYQFSYFTYHLDFLNTEFVKDFGSYFYAPRGLKNHLLNNIYSISNTEIKLYEYKNIITRLIYKYSKIDNLFNFNVKKIKIEKYFGEISILLTTLKSTLEKEVYANEYQDEPINIFNFLESLFKKSINDKEKFLIYLLLKHIQTDKKALDIIYILIEDPDKNINDLEKDIFEFKNNNITISHYRDFYALIYDDLYTRIYEINTIRDKIAPMFNDGIQNLLDITYYDEKDRVFKDLSQGERHIFTIILLIYNKVVEANNTNSLILLDEPDITLHPQWQKSLINILVKTFQKTPKYNINLILTTHSPFIISDIPKENVVFLDTVESDKSNTKEKYPNINIDDLEDGNCINVSKYINMKPFGANIHTLLSDGFFMKDGLMGEFAKDKINKVIKILKKPSLSSDEIKTCKHIISIIGEPILQKTLEYQLNEKINPNETELQKLEREQLEIEEKISKLKESTSNETN